MNDELDSENEKDYEHQQLAASGGDEHEKMERDDRGRKIDETAVDPCREWSCG